MVRAPNAGLVPMRGESAPQSQRPRLPRPAPPRPALPGARPGGDDKSRQAKRQAVEKLTGRGNERANDASANILTHLPADLFFLIAINLDGKSIKEMLSTCRAWRAQGSSPEFWKVLCKSQYPWLPHMSACMPQPQPPLRQLYFRQALRRKGARKATTYPLSDYSYVMGIFGEKNEPPLVAKNGQLGECIKDSCIKDTGRFAVDLWGLGPHGFPDLPAWASKIITDFRTNDAARDHGLPHENDSAAWMDSEGRRLASKLRVMMCITRPDGKSFCLYDGIVSRDPSMNSMAITSCEYKTVDVFWMKFEKTGLPNAQSFTRVITRHKGLKLVPVLSLHHKDALAPFEQPELYLQITMPSTNSDDSVLATDAELLRYFKNFAPFE